MKFAYCGYDFFYPCIEAVIRHGHELVELFTWPTDNEYDFNDNVFRVAQSCGSRITMSAIDNIDIERLKAMGVELLICAAYPFKIPIEVRSIKYHLNVHPSLLPEGRGRWPLPWIILKELQFSGVSLHVLSSAFDAGPLLLQQKITVSPRENLESLSFKTRMVALKLVEQFLDDKESIWRKQVIQDRGSYWPMPAKSDRTLTWDMGAAEIDKVVRAFSKFEAFIYLESVRYFVRRVDFWLEDHDVVAGTLVLKGNREMLFAAKDGFVVLSSFVKAEDQP